MLHKTFQIVLITFVTIFTALGAIVLLSALIPVLFSVPAQSGGGSVTTFVYAISQKTLQLILIVFLIAAGLYLITKRNRLR